MDYTLITWKIDLYGETTSLVMVLKSLRTSNLKVAQLCMIDVWHTICAQKTDSLLHTVASIVSWKNTNHIGRISTPWNILLGSN